MPMVGCVRVYAAKRQVDAPNRVVCYTLQRNYWSIRCAKVGAAIALVCLASQRAAGRRTPMLSVNNGNSFVDVHSLSDSEIGSVLECGLLDQEVSDSVMTTVSDREWLEEYCDKHFFTHGSYLIIG